MKDEAVSPHGDRNGVVAICEAVGTDEEPFAFWEYPDRQHAESVDKVTEICEEVVVAPFLVCVCPDGHKVEELCRVPIMEPLRVSTDQIAADEDV